MSKIEIQFLPKRFFRDNPLKELSAAMFAYAKAGIEQDSALNDELNKIALAQCDTARRTNVVREQQLIEQTDSPAQLIELMRKHDIINCGLLCAKIAANAEQTIPLLLERYCRCLQDEFIETASTVLRCCDIRYTQQLRELYPQIRAPYAQATACLTFGAKKMTEQIPFLLEQYRRFQRDYPEENFSQFPLLALYLLHGRI